MAGFQQHMRWGWRLTGAALLAAMLLLNLLAVLPSWHAVLHASAHANGHGSDSAGVHDGDGPGPGHEHEHEHDCDRPDCVVLAIAAGKFEGAPLIVPPGRAAIRPVALVSPSNPWAHSVDTGSPPSDRAPPT